MGLAGLVLLEDEESAKLPLPKTRDRMIFR